MSPAHTLVANGVALLDEHNPGWHERIDLGSLRLSTCSGCILGQLYGVYATGLEALGIKTGEKHGFAVAPGFYGDYSFGDLENVWVDEIVARRNHSETEVSLEASLV